MPKVYKNGAFIEDDSATTAVPSLEEWLDSSSPKTGVELLPDQPPTPLLSHLNDLLRINIRFTTFMDGRGFSYARELRDQGFHGELRAVGAFIPDQLLYLRRCGFDAFEVSDELSIEDIETLLGGIDEHYQACADQAAPLSARRSH